MTHPARRSIETTVSDWPLERPTAGRRERIPFGEERHREESPCPGCGVYYFDFHEAGCPFEECPACGGPRASCGCEVPEAG